MSYYGRLTLRILSLIWAGMTVFAQPGLPPCWLEAQACQTHAHFSPTHEQTPHSHAYLFDLAQSSTLQALPNLVIPLSVLLALLGGARPRQRLTAAVLPVNAWISPLDPPPPRAILSH